MSLKLRVAVWSPENREFGQPFSYDHLGMSIKQWKFPGGEVGIKLDGDLFDDEMYDILVDGIVSSDDIIAVANTCNALKHRNVPRSRISVTMPYFPYARQDRICHSGESFALETFIQLLDAMYFDKLTVWDLHSDVSVRLLNQSNKIIIHKKQHELMKNLPQFEWYIAPDTGASSKILSHGAVNPDNLIILNKTRTECGISYEMEQLQSKLQCSMFRVAMGSAVIVDDICDGGATFISVAQSLKKLNPNISLNLAITHGIFSKGLEELSQYYDSIYVVNLMNDNIPSTKIIVLK